jgi:hypothetical protein
MYIELCLGIESEFNVQNKTYIVWRIIKRIFTIIIVVIIIIIAV